MEQNKSDWLSWRSKGIGSSDSPILHNESPYKDRYELFLDKTGQATEELKNDYITFRGQELEPVIRKRWATIAALDLGIESDWKPLNIDSGGKVMRASLDGYAENEKIISEFKFQGKDAHEAIEQKICPRHYWIQVQHQLLVSGAKKGYLVSYNPDLDTINYMEILPNVSFHNEHIKKCREFWAEVTSKTPSEYTLSFKKDEKKSDDARMKIIAKRYAEMSEQIKKMESDLETMKNELVAANGAADKTDFEFVTITKAIRTGLVSYKDIPEVKALSKDYLANFKKPDVEYFTIKIRGKK